MLSKEERKEAIRKAKERKTPLGVFAVRCAAGGQAWVGVSKNLDAAKNGLWFGLRLGSHRDKTLQQAWSEFGEPAFEYEVLEILKEDVHPQAVADLLREKRASWVALLGAHPLL